MSIIKIIEVIATSDQGFDEAVQNAVDEASETVDNIESVYVKEMKANVENNQVVSYGVNAKVSFRVNEG
ncbi:MAG: dodecin domain-containing protein [Balneolaceae bacterium]|nr:dodecin domain-containing protein [Balneolaceae bacterium]